MIDVSDLESIPFLKINPLMDLCGIGGNKYSQRKSNWRKSNGTQFLKVIESEAIIKTLAEYGFTYNRENNKHWKPIEAKSA